MKRTSSQSKERCHGPPTAADRGLTHQAGRHRRCQRTVRLAHFAVYIAMVPSFASYVVGDDDISPANLMEDRAFPMETSSRNHPNPVLSLGRGLKSKGSKHTKHAKQAHSLQKDQDLRCHEEDYSKRVLKLVYEQPMAALFADYSYESKFETSDVVVVNGEAYAVCDSSWSLYKFGLDLEPSGTANVRFDNDPHFSAENVQDSEYEAITFHQGTFYVVRESVEHKDGSYRAIIDEIQIQEDGISQAYTKLRRCSADFEFEGDSKGFEGVWALQDLNEELVLLALCEGNHCSEKYKHDRGNGKVVVLKQELLSDNSCRWIARRTLDIPASANFNDYSAIALNKEGFVAITSQEDSQLWVGRLLGKADEGESWDVDTMEFDQVGEVFDFAKDDECGTVYCNIEGIHFLEERKLLAVSDKMKKNGKQDKRCQEKDQSVHVFALP